MLYRGGLFRCNGVGSARRPRHVTAGQHMEMQVFDSLAGLIATVVDDAVALCAQLTAQLGDDGEAVGHHSLVALVNLGGAADMLLLNVIFRDSDIFHSSTPSPLLGAELLSSFFLALSFLRR